MAVVVVSLAVPIIAVAQTEWVDDPSHPVVPAPDPGAWDAERYLGAVIHDESGFRMWYGGNDGQVCRAGYATSPDGSLWTKHPDPVMDVGPPGSFDAQWASLDTVIVQDGHYQAWYWAAASQGVWRIGYAESDNGLSWTKHPEPVVESAWSPEVLFDGQLYSMWYSVAASIWADIHYAVSPDGVGWIPYSSNPVLGLGSSLPAVLFDSGDGVYKLWYQGPGFSFRMATSECCATVFLDGFESGDTSAWSATVP